jgi:hypothetical protein
MSERPQLNGFSDAAGLPLNLSMRNEGHGVNLGCGEGPSPLLWRTTINCIADEH